MRGLLIVGAGGHGKVVADTAKATGLWDSIAFLDKEARGNICGWPILGTEDDLCYLQDTYRDIVVAIGDNKIRTSLLTRFLKLGFNCPPIVHPSAYISKQSIIGAGTVIFAQAVVNIGTHVGQGCIINTGVTVDHDCFLADGVHLSPGVHLGGNVNIGKNTWLGVGSSVIHQISIGNNVLIGAGSVIVEPVEDNVTVVGVPGRVIKRNG